MRLREMILSGELLIGAKLREVALAERLGVSRTPLRLGLGILAREGLLDYAPRRGFSVRDVTLDQIFAAFDVRGALEALAAREVAIRGLSGHERARLEGDLADGDALLDSRSFDENGTSAWIALNARLHDRIVHMADIRPVTDALAFNARLPLVSPGAIAFCRGQAALALDLMGQAQRQHVAIVESLKRREVDRVQALMVEHAYQSREFLKQLLAGAQAMQELQRVMQQLRAATERTQTVATGGAERRAGHPKPPSPKPMRVLPRPPT